MVGCGDARPERNFQRKFAVQTADSLSSLLFGVLRFFGVAGEEFLELLSVGGLGVRRALIRALEANGKSPVEDVSVGSAVGTVGHNLWTTHS
jgi:hypothetical protein